MALVYLSESLFYCVGDGTYCKLLHRATFSDQSRYRNFIHGSQRSDISALWTHPDSGFKLPPRHLHLQSCRFPQQRCPEPKQAYCSREIFFLVLRNADLYLCLNHDLYLILSQFNSSCCCDPTDSGAIYLVPYFQDEHTVQSNPS
jgi:hypothetical protein